MLRWEHRALTQLCWGSEADMLLPLSGGHAEELILAQEQEKPSEAER